MKPYWIKKSFVAFPLLLLAIAGCNKNLVSIASQPVILPSDGGQVIAAQNKFALNLFKQTLQDDNSTSNKLISPLSVYLDLSMAYNGAAGSTQTAMQQAMQLNGIDTNLLNQTNQSLISGLPKTDPHIALNIANSIWYRDQGFQPLSDFLKMTSNFYNAEVNAADFSNPATVGKINNWVAAKTNQEIKTIIQNIDPDDIMYLINAVYFKGQWKYSFDPNKTQNKPFYTIGNGVVQTPFMTQTATFKYMADDSAQCIELPYGNGDFNMYVLLPNQPISLQGFISNLNENTLSSYLSTTDSLTIQLQLPRWEYSYEVQDMKPELTSMGMGNAFTSQANFSNMYPPAAGAYISKVIHKTYIEVNEQGTEAAAATAVGMATYSLDPDLPMVMDVNRPFLYVIAEKNTGVILFIGEVNNPAEGSH
ncbi:MAG: serpin family protein [Chitinophagaceae bacterium]